MSATVEFTDIMKVGGAVLGIEDEKERLVGQRDETFDTVGAEISVAENNIILGTSFAIGMGMLETGEHVRPSDDRMPELQRLATIGQPLVQRRWATAISQKTTGEILLTKQELDSRNANAARLREILETIQVLFAHGDVPVVNENDAITHEEITFGSNDILTATLAAAMQRSGHFGQVRLFMLTDVNGVYRDKEDPTTRIPIIERINSYRHLAKGPDSKLSIGGMKSKFGAAYIASHAGVPAYVYNPADGPRDLAVEGEIGTYFPIWTPHNA